MSQKIVMLAIRVPVEWRDAIRDQAIDKKQTLTTFCSNALLKSLPKDVREALPEREFNPLGRPAK